MSGFSSEWLKALQSQVEKCLLPQLHVQIIGEGEPVEIASIPTPWQIVGKGNYAVVVEHPEFPGVVVKVYVEADNSCREEAAVYRALGEHPAFSRCYLSGERYLLLKKLNGVTLYDCVIRGIRVEKQVIIDVEVALEYARLRGLYPHDVHGKNLMMHEGRGYVVDISDFYINEDCRMWSDLKKAYERIYLKTLFKFPIPVPAWMLNLVRKGYRAYRKRLRSQIAK